MGFKTVRAPWFYSDITQTPINQCFSSLLQDMVIQEDDEIRIKIVGTRVDATDIVSTNVLVFQLIFIIFAIYTGGIL